jgi:thiamine pyrophosphokinase
MRVLIVVHPVPKDIKKIITLKDDDYVIAVDQAVLDLYKQRIKIDLAVGDFDSLKNEGILTQLNVVRLKPEKDVTDTYQALVEASKLNPDELLMIGGIGGDRIEHFVVHLMHFNEFKNLRILNDNSEIFMLEEGIKEISFDGYISVFAYPEATITLDGFKYPLNNYKLTQYDPLGISNEMVKEKAQIHVHQGRVLVILSQKDR